MKDTPLFPPENIAHADLVTEQFVTPGMDEMQIPKSVRNVPGFIYRLFTKIERVMLGKKPD